jgi:class 3 adenylate cyclase
MSWVSRLVNLGVSEGSPASVIRRVQTINVVALLALGLNLIFSTSFFLLIDSSGAWMLRGLNLAIVLAYAASIAINAAHRTDAATWLLNGTGLVNIVVSSLVLGLGLGSFTFFVIVPLTAFLTSREDDLVVPLVFTVGSVVGLSVVVMAEPSVPATVAGTEWQSVVLIGNVVSVVVFATVVALYYRRRVDRAEAELAEQHARAEALLLNILPTDTAERLKSGERVIADGADDVSVLFVDLVGSTSLAAALPPGDLVALLNDVFSAFDDLADQYGLEKIKTVGDAYIAVGGLPRPDPDHLTSAADLALAIRDEIRRYVVPGIGPLEIRLGLHTGPVVAGVIGKRKFSYDIWGDTVNIASRMESTGIPGEIQVTTEVRERLNQDFEFEQRGTIDIKGKGQMHTFLLKARASTSRP